MFDFLKKRKLPQAELELYEWFNEKRKESRSYWKNVLRKAIKEDYFLRNKRAWDRGISGKASRDEKGMMKRTRWKHDLYGEIKDISDFWKNIDHLFKKIMSAILRRELKQELSWINNKIEFIKKAIKEERKQIQKRVNAKPPEYGDEVVRHRAPTGDIVIKDKHYWQRLDRLIKESDKVFLDVMDWTWSVLAEIKEKISPIEKK